MVKAAPRHTARVVQLRKGTTLEMVRLACPDATQATRISESFGLAVLDSNGIRDLHERLIVETADSLSEGLAERAMQIHLQRIVGAYVGSAHGAGQFYTRAVTEARDATAKSACDDRDEDLDGPVGFDGKAQRRREFAAQRRGQRPGILVRVEFDHSRGLRGRVTRRREDLLADRLRHAVLDRGGRRRRNVRRAVHVPTLVASPAEG